ncbi:MAG: hypothetical protein M3125_02830 [Gemmatimonadota bacterium]|nr:hypothetical protein [Gemmatimonadota bacterium]
MTAAAAAAGALYDARPPLARTGGFGERTCGECHFGGPEPLSGTVTLGGVPEQYRPGEAYTLEVVLVDTTARVGGFQVAARIADGATAGKQAGVLCAIDSRVAVAADSTSGVQYASHAIAAPADSLRWPLMWNAPTGDVGNVIFHIVANAADDDDSPLGDAILTNTVVSRPKKAASASEPAKSGC